MPCPYRTAAATEFTFIRAISFLSRLRLAINKLAVYTRPVIFGPEESCGIFGVWGCENAAELTNLGLFALQHRGQESAGIATATSERLHTVRGMGLVVDVFRRNKLDDLPGEAAVGHVRYSTAGESNPRNMQPIIADTWRGPMALAHNGNLVNVMKLRDRYERSGHIFQSNADSEIFIHLIAASRFREVEDAVNEMIPSVRGAYALVLLTCDRMMGIRDPYGFRPLSFGIKRKPDGKSEYYFASESCAFDLVNRNLDEIRDVEPGEMIVIDESGHRSEFPFADACPQALCIFEYVYFARPDSVMYGRTVYEVRKEFGRALARAEESDFRADFVIPIPDSGVAAALGYAGELGLPFEMGMIRSHYVGRTFIDPEHRMRKHGVKIKLSPIRSLIKGKEIVVVDDSIVRGNTSRNIVELLRACGAKKIHLRVSSPPVTHTCCYGIDIKSQDELIANQKEGNIREIAERLNVETLKYLTLEDMLTAAGAADGKGFCRACFTGEYPLPEIRDRRRHRQLDISY